MKKPALRRFFVARTWAKLAAWAALGLPQTAGLLRLPQVLAQRLASLGRSLLTGGLMAQKQKPA